MAPNLSNQPNLDNKSRLNASPLLILSSEDEESSSSYSSTTFSSSPSEQEFVSPRKVPLEHNLRGLLVKVTGSEDLAVGTQVKLRVMAQETPLQHLSLHMPALRELILDGSVLCTLRDLGSGLRNLRVLKVNRCGLVCIDGVFGFEGLEELRAADNSIADVAPCAFLGQVRVVDLSRNCLENVKRALPFLSMCCEHLEHIFLQGNDGDEMIRCNSARYRQTVRSLLPKLKTLDGIAFPDEETLLHYSTEENAGKTTNSERKSPHQQHQSVFASLVPQRGRHIQGDISSGFTVTFPPKVFQSSHQTK